MFERAMLDNLASIESALRAEAPVARLLDIGCDDGERSRSFGDAALARALYGIEAVPARAALAAQRGLHVEVGDVEAGLPWEDEFFDAVVSNQVIEHLRDTDTFVTEIRRVLKPGGVAVVSTENLASWHNVFAAALGWQPFSLTNVTSTRSGLGNPLALHRDAAQQQPETWQHVRVFAFRGLVELFQSHGLPVEAVRGAGYYPFPGRLARMDARHAALITLTARRD
jgi:SAM-dependent methyltransferase